MRLMRQNRCDASWPPPPSSLGRATRCSSPRAAPRRTCSPTTPPAVTRSPRRCRSGWPAALGRGAQPDDHREPRAHPAPPLRAAGPAPAPAAPAAGPRGRHRVARQTAHLVRLAPRRARPAAHVLLPAARRLRAAAHHRADHGAERQQRLLLRGQRRRLLRRGPAPARLGAARAAAGMGRQPAAAPLGAAAGLPRLLGLAGAAPAHGVLRRRAQRQPELARRRPGRDPALGDRQARDGHLGGAHLRQQGAPARQHPRDHRAGGAGDDPGHRARGARQRPRHGPGAVRAAARARCGWWARPGASSP